MYEDYQSVKGILIPMRKVIENDGQRYTTQYTEIILNPELQDDIFECDPE